MSSRQMMATRHCLECGAATGEPIDLQYVEYEEAVFVSNDDEQAIRINVAGDSSVAMIRDVLNRSFLRY